jgi:hypothetical protein
MPPETVAGVRAEGAKVESAPAAGPVIDELKRLRQQQIEALALAGAAEDPQTVDRLAARVQSLTTAIDTLEKSTTKARDRRLTIAAGAAAVLLTGTLLLLHRSHAEIVANEITSETGFTVTTPFAPLRGMTSVVLVELTGLTRVRQEDVPEITAQQDEDLLLRVQPDPSSKNPGSIGFDSLTVPVGTLIELNHTGPGNTIELRFLYPRGSSPELDLDVTGDLEIALEGRHHASFAAPVRITAVPAGDARVIVRFGSPLGNFSDAGSSLIDFVEPGRAPHIQQARRSGRGIDRTLREIVTRGIQGSFCQSSPR